MSSKSFKWKDQLEVGSRGEELLMEHYPTPLVIYAAHRADFRRLSDGKLVELKTDTYSLEKTENIFAERWGNIEEKKPGGPWRARKDRVGVFIYYFSGHNVWLEWDTKELCKLLDKLTKKSKLVYIKSSGWCVAGYKVAIRDVLSIAKVHAFETPSVNGAADWQAFLLRTEK